MKTIKAVLGVFLLSVFLSSCATGPTWKPTAEYTAGREAGEEQADDDVLKVQCGWPWEPNYLEISRKAQSYGESLREEGRSEDFVNGFYSGYTEVFYDRLESLCSI